MSINCLESTHKTNFHRIEGVSEWRKLRRKTAKESSWRWLNFVDLHLVQSTGSLIFFNDWQVRVILKYRSQFLVNKPPGNVLNLVNWGKASNILLILYFKRRFFWRPPDVKYWQPFPLPPFHPLAFRIFNIGSGRAWKWNNNWAGDWSSVQFSPTHEYSNELSPDMISSFATSSTDQSKSHPFAHNSFSTHTQHSLSVVMFVGTLEELWLRKWRGRPSGVSGEIDMVWTGTER